MHYQATVTVSLKPGVLDPQGAAVKSTLIALGYAAVAEVAVGRHITLELDAPSREAAASQAEEIARRVLANPVLERFAIDLTEAV